MQLITLTYDELLRWAHTQLDALTSTELEVELLRRFEEHAALAAEAEPLLALMDEHSLADADELRKVIDKAAALDERLNGIGLLDVLREFDIDDPKTLKKLLQRDAQLHDVLDSLAQPMADLQALAA